MEPFSPPGGTADERRRSARSPVGTRARARRACDRCRQMKVRCELSMYDLEGQCARCAQNEWPCKGALPPPTRDCLDARLQALEDQVVIVRASVEASLRRAQTADHFEQEGLGLESHATPLPTSCEQPCAAHTDSQGWNKKKRPRVDVGDSTSQLCWSGSPTSSQALHRKFKRQQHSHLPSPAATSPTQDLFLDADAEISHPDANTDLHTPKHMPDVIERGIVTVEEAVELFNLFFTDLAPLMPAVAFQPGANPLSIRRSKPIFFLAVLLAGSWIKQTGIQHLLTKEFLRVFSIVHLQRGERSLELVQALQVATLWYMLPVQHDRIQIYTWINMAATMAMDIGLDRMRLPAAKEESQGRYFASQNSAAKPSRVGTVEEIRAWVTCYYLCIAYQRLSLIRWTPYLAECEQLLLSTSPTPDSDQVLCRWVRLAHLSEDIQHGNMGMMPHEIVKECERRLEASRMSLHGELENVFLQMYERIVFINMHEIVLRDHKLSSDNVPYLEGVLLLGEESISTNLPHIDGDLFTACLDAIYNLFDIFLSTEITVLARGAVFTFSRIVYAVLVLLKIYLVARDGHAGLEKDLSKTRLELYLNALIENFGRINGDGASRGARMFQTTLRTFQKWLQSQPKPRIVSNTLDSPSHQARPSYETNEVDEQSSPGCFGEGSLSIDRTLPQSCQKTKQSKFSSFSGTDGNTTELCGELDEEISRRIISTPQVGSACNSPSRSGEQNSLIYSDLSGPWSEALLLRNEDAQADLLWSELQIDPLSGEMMNNVNLMFRDWNPGLFPAYN